MTTPQEFYQNTMNMLKWYDKHLPANSHIVVVGVIHGELMWDIMSNNMNPALGITYADMWEIGNSIHPNSDSTLNACWAWLNPAVYWRNFASNRALQLSQVYQDIVSNTTFENFKLYYMDHPDTKIVANWIKSGQDPSDLYQAADGGHPSQTAQVLWADAIWNTIESQWPEVLGDVNPFNAEIESMFGDQGGY